MGVTTTNNKPLNPRGNDQSPLAYNRAKLFSGKALDFDGVNDYVEIDSFAGTLSDDDAWTACGYFKTDSNAIRTTWFSAHDSTGGNVIRVGTSQNLDGLFYADAYTTDVQIGDFDFKDNKWHFVALSREQGANGSLVTLLVDGVELTSRTSGPNWDIATQFSLGQEYDGGSFSDYWKGLLANFKIFNTALTAAQVADLYNNPEKVVPTGVDNTALKLWLPMQEGAGTTAYDGSGNGNHGAISGATYVHGIGAPVAQTAVIDWNKGTNIFEHSEEFNDSYWTNALVNITANDIAAPDGQTTADKALETSGTGYRDVILKSITGLTIGETLTFSCYLKGGLGRDGVYLYANNGARVAKFNLATGAYIGNAPSTHNAFDSYGITDAGDGWYRLHATINSPTSTGIVFTIGISNNTNDAIGTYAGDVTKGVYAWGAQLEKASSVGPYTPTIATAQTSEVLLPQGLTSGRDITGVNLFENVRKQGALNLDGNSWAEVHDNGSLDFGTGEFTLEAWVKVNYENQGSSYNSILTLGGSSTANTALNTRLGVEIRFYYNGSDSKTSVTIGDWVHIVGTYDETNATLYLNGSQVDQDARTATNITNTSSKMIGHDTANNRHYPDQIAQPRIYNRALTAEEVQRNYNAGKNTYTN